MTTPLTTAGLRHVALSVTALEECVTFYTQVLAMVIEWQPDPDNVYLTSGNDNLALHRATTTDAPATPQRLDHLGFVLNTPEDVDRWHAHFISHGVPILAKPKTHRDGARSFYAKDPDGTVIQLIYHPPLASVSSIVD